MSNVTERVSDIVELWDRALSRDAKAWHDHWSPADHADYTDACDLAKEQRTVAADAWQRVERKIELMFGLSVGLIGWLSLYGEKLHVPTCCVIASVIACELAAVIVAIAWWKSAKPMSLSTRSAVELTDLKANVKGWVAADTFLMIEQTREILFAKVLLVKLAALFILVAVSISSIGAITQRFAPYEPTLPQSSYESD